MQLVLLELVEMERPLLLQDLLSQKVVEVEVVLMGLVGLLVKEAPVVVLMVTGLHQIDKHQVHQQTLPLVVAVVVELLV